MDPLAHTLFGASLAEAGLKEKTALATGTLIIGANLPDIDVLSMFVSSDFALLMRRGWTHGLLALVAGPFLLTGLMLLYDHIRQRIRRSRHPANYSSNSNSNASTGSVITSASMFPGQNGPLDTSGPSLHPGRLLAISFLAVWSHSFLDWLNTYGIRLLMPFSETWFYGDTLFIIDPWLWLLTGAAVVLARSKSLPGMGGWVILGTAATALVTTTDVVPLAAKILWTAGIAVIILIRQQKWLHEKIQPTAIICLTAALLYVVFMFTGTRFTAWHVRNHLSENGIEIQHVMASPQPARLLHRNGVAVSKTHYYRFRVNWIHSESVEIIGEPVPRQAPDRIVQAALRSPDVQGLRNWMRFPAYEVRPLDDGWRVFIRDLRFTDPHQESASGFGMAVVDLDRTLQVRTSSR
ncbi:MAG: metal-dependent hydrolase [Balneolales bacterium]